VQNYENGGYTTFISLRVFGFVIAISAVGVAIMVLSGVSEKGDALFIFMSHVVIGIACIAYSRLNIADKKASTFSEQR
jgi:hypothetical protein